VEVRVSGAALLGVPSAKLQIKCYPSNGNNAAAIQTTCRVHLELFYFREADATQESAQVPAGKISDNLSLGSIIGDAPSGPFPSGDTDAQAARFPRYGGEDQGLDCILSFCLKVCSVKKRPYLLVVFWQGSFL